MPGNALSTLPPKIETIPGAWPVPWPERLAPCPRCGRKHQHILIGSVDCLLDHYQCPECGWFCMGDYTASERRWNREARQYLEDLKNEA